MTSLILGIASPILGGLISIVIWQTKKNSEQVQRGMINLHACVHEVSTKVDVLSLDVAKNYCTRDELKEHVDKEEGWHDKFSQDLTEMKEMQWKIRMDMLDMKDKN